MVEFPLANTKGVWFFFFWEYIYIHCIYYITFAIDQTRGTVQWFERVFFFALVEKKTVLKSKNGWSHRNHEHAAIFVKNLKCNIFQVFRPFFFQPERKKNCKVGLMKGREENLFVQAGLWKPYLFYHTFWKLKGLFHGTLYPLSLGLVLSLQKFFWICFSKPFSFSKNVLFS